MMINVYKKPCLTLAVSAGMWTLVFLSSVNRAGGAEETLPNLAQPMIPIMVTTTESFEGYRIKEYKGIVRGITVRQPSIGQSLKANLKGIVGGKISPFIRMCETARQQAMDIMIERAQSVGANAVVAFRYDSSAYGDSDEMGTEVVCYGTAVIIAPKDSPLKSANLN
jgi:uncharacterized protein YbjQ (UPF0145 family)